MSPASAEDVSTSFWIARSTWSAGGTTSTVAVSVSVTGSPFTSNPVAVAVFVVSTDRAIEHEYVHVSVRSSSPLLLASPPPNTTGEHLSSVTDTFANGTSPPLVTAYE